MFGAILSKKKGHDRLSVLCFYQILPFIYVLRWAKYILPMEYPLLNGARTAPIYIAAKITIG